MSPPNIIPLELEEHLTLSDWLNRKGVFYIHIPNEGKRSVQQAVMLKRMGMKKGAPDFIIPGFPNIALELKRIQVIGKKGGKITPSSVSKEQDDCLGALAKLGWVTTVSYGAAEAIGWLLTQPLTMTPLKRIDVF